MTTVELDTKLDPIVDKLLERSNGVYDASFVRHLVLQVAAEFDGAPVQDYVAVLVAKEASDELRRLHALQSIAS
jgi:hypothetical protein